MEYKYLQVSVTSYYIFYKYVGEFKYVPEVLNVQMNEICFGNSNFSWNIVRATNKNDYH